MRNYKNHLIIIILCIGIFSLIIYFLRDKYSEVSKDLIYEVAARENFKILDYEIMNDVERPFAYIFFERRYKIGVYWIMVKNNKLNYGESLIMGVSSKNKVETIGISSGYPYELIRIHDKDILNKGKVILFSFGNKKQHQLSMNKNKKDYMIVGDYEEGIQSSSPSLVILDEKDQIIYEEEF